MNHKIAVLLLTALLTAGLCACSDKESSLSPDGDSPQQENLSGNVEEETVSVKNIADDLLENGSFPAMYELNEKEIERQFNLSPSLFSQVYAASADEYPGIECIFIGQLADEASKDEVTDALNSYLETLKAEYVDYLPAEYAKAKQVKVYSKSDFVCLVVAGDSDKALNIVKNHIK